MTTYNTFYSLVDKNTIKITKLVPVEMTYIRIRCPACEGIILIVLPEEDRQEMNKRMKQDNGCEATCAHCNGIFIVRIPKIIKGKEKQ